MNTPMQVHVNALDRLYRDEVITKQEFERLIKRLLNMRVEDGDKKNG